jgi:hypothetical protein
LRIFSAKSSSLIFWRIANAPLRKADFLAGAPQDFGKLGDIHTDRLLANDNQR